jgi:hypothetical protein
MSKTSLLGMTAVMALAVALPAQADWVRLGSVHVEHGRDRDSTYSQFAGPVENLTFTARGSDMWCRDITAHYGNGQRDRVYSGKLYKDQSIDTDVKGRERRIERLTMNCSASSARGGEIQIGANVGRFRQAWDKTKFWATRFTRDAERRLGMSDDRSHNGWVTIGRENFQGRRDSESTTTGWRGRNVERIALRPVDNDARCMRISATFNNGRTRDLDVDRKDVMQRGRLTIIDLPGDQRNLRSVDLRCRAVGDRDVTIEILARN